MRTLFKLAGMLAIVGAMTSCNDAKKTTADYRIIPMPQEIIKNTEGNFELGRE